MIKLLIEFGANQIFSNYKKCELLLYFNFRDNDMEGVLEYFMSLGVDINWSIKTAIRENRSKGGVYLENLLFNDSGVMSLLIKHMDSVVLDGLLLQACKKGCFSAAKLLLANGADFEKTESDGLNVYLAAIKSGNLEMVKLMLPLSDKNYVDNAGNGPFHYIYRIDSADAAVEIFEFLYEMGVNMKIIDKRGMHPVLDTARRRNSSNVLIEKFFEKKEHFLDFKWDIEDVLRLTGHFDLAKIISKNKLAESKKGI